VNLQTRLLSIITRVNAANSECRQDGTRKNTLSALAHAAIPDTIGVSPGSFAMNSRGPQITTGLESLVRLEELLSCPDAEPYHGTRRLEIRGEVRFEAVEFSDGKIPLLAILLKDALQHGL
jgi:hypothetical protein